MTDYQPPTLHADWTTAAGLRAVITCCTTEDPMFLHYYNGYVGVPTGHPYYLHDYDSCPGVSVHGGLTYGSLNWPLQVPGLWWLGFDTCHGCDIPRFGGTPKSPDYVRAECEKLAGQLKALAQH